MRSRALFFVSGLSRGLTMMREGGWGFLKGVQKKEGSSENPGQSRRILLMNVCESLIINHFGNSEGELRGTGPEIWSWGLTSSTISAGIASINPFIPAESDDI